MGWHVVQHEYPLDAEGPLPMRRTYHVQLPGGGLAGVHERWCPALWLGGGCVWLAKHRKAEHCFGGLSVCILAVKCPSWNAAVRAFPGRRLEVVCRSVNKEY